MRDPITRRDVVALVEQCLGADTASYDVDKIVDTLTDRHGLDGALDAADFWEVVLDHTLTPEPTRTVQEQVWPLVQAAMGRTAEWTSDEGVTVQITGMSPVSPVLPQPLARADVTGGTAPVHLAGDDLTWESLTAAVDGVREDIDAIRGDVERELRASGTEYEQAAQRMSRAETRRHQAIRKAAKAGVSAAQIGELCGLSRQRVHRILKSGTTG
ncbi:hypothetical protein ACN95_14705 [Gordonia sihwensis]|uniref:helix-turn-helix domain-containing protein n=1 Tax=Gordonia sihwensis TaxID=173559 RepID=UPI001C92F8D1|nr:helix-turn-helix domain-containing protein [Gordonia sihwensis]MBY4571268.1 hypothetical protein [Gordonia sihwensis]